MTAFFITHLQKLQEEEKTHSNTRVRLFTLVRPAGFEPVAYRVGVIRRSIGKPLGANGFVGFDRFAKFDKKTLEALRCNASRVFLDSSQIVVNPV